MELTEKSRRCLSLIQTLSSCYALLCNNFSTFTTLTSKSKPHKPPVCKLFSPGKKFIGLMMAILSCSSIFSHYSNTLRTFPCRKSEIIMIIIITKNSCIADPNIPYITNTMLHSATTTTKLFKSHNLQALGF